MKRRLLLTLSCLIFCAAAATVFPAAPTVPTVTAANGPTAAAAAQRRRDINGTVIGIGGPRAGRSAPFRLIIESYTPEGEVAQLNSALQSGGDDELLRVLSKMKAGRITVGNNVGVPANAVIATPTGEGGTKLTVLFERNVNIYELRYGTRSSDYRFGYAEIFLDRNGRGEGTFIPAARVRLRGSNTWEVEDFGVFPARIMGVRATGNVPAR
jgi:hypothetical protein